MDLSYLLHDQEGQIELAHSISAGLDYPGMAQNMLITRYKTVEYRAVTDAQALRQCSLPFRRGIIPALKQHTLLLVEELMPKTTSEEIVVLNCSGRGDKDMETISKYL